VLRPRTLAAKLLTIGSALLVLAVVSIGLTMWVSWQLEGGAAAVNEAGRLRMQTWRLAAQVHAGSSEVAAALAAEFDTSLALLRDGDPARPLTVPWDEPSRAQFAAVGERWSQLRREWLAQGTHSPTQTAQQATEFVGQVDRFVGAVEHSLAAWTAILSLFQMAMMGLAIASALVLLYAGHAFVLTPLATLRSGLERVQRGDLAARVDVAARDEFGDLADGFNRMAETLQGLYRNLEFKVREKTAHLEVQRERLTRLYTMSDFLARAATLDEMATGFARQIRAMAGADAAAIRWSDEANQRYVLLAGDCLPQSIAEDEHCVRTGDCLCGQPRDGASTRVIPIRGEALARMDHCVRAGYQTLVSVPVMLQQRVLGEIDLFFRDPATLRDEERQHLDALASHLASAMEGLRAEALERESAVAQERGLLARELHDSIAQSLAFLKIQVGLLRQAIQRRDQAAIDRTLDELDAGVRESTADVRELLVHFRTRTNAEDIVPALRTTLQKFEHQTGLSTHLDVEGEGLPLAPDVQVQVLHVVQEALSNVRKHADAREVWVEVHQAEPWSVEVRDDGRGFDAAGGPPGEMHVGLRIMRERAARVGARVSVDSVPGAGTCVSLTLPARQEAVAA
jgi:two-component system nitrate/nitrite sensor histidine kinase NarX